MDANDASHLHRLFELDRVNNGLRPKRMRKIGLYGLDMYAMVDQGKDLFTENELKDPELIALSAQAYVRFKLQI